jgi:ribosomal protein S18 acetylase RimI-like enzyme
MLDPDHIERLQTCDGTTFREFYEIYAASIVAREQKPEAWICRMVEAPNYRVWVIKGGGHVQGFSILFLAPEGFALLEYMAVAPGLRHQGVGSKLFTETVARAMDRNGQALPVLLEVDSEREICGDREVRVRRQRFYRRLGCLRVAGMHYILPLSGDGAPPEMDLLVYSAHGLRQLAKATLEAWLATIYRDVYHTPTDDPRITRMLRSVPDPVSLE